jgi:hypothetical protein
MVKAILTPAHTDTLEALLNQPFTGTFHHSGAQGETETIKGLISGVVVVALKVGLYLKQGGKGGGRPTGQMNQVKRLFEKPKRVSNYTYGVG